MSVKCKVIENYEVFGKCVEITNGTVKAIVTADIGPRILFYGFCDGENVLHEDHSNKPNWLGKAWDEYYYEGAKAYIYGGHRIWATPEGAPETYYPDKIIHAGKATYVERNYEMINKSHFCIVYYDAQNVPTTRKSGTQIALDYARKKRKKMIRV